MKLLLLCLGLTLVCAHDEDNHDVVTSNIDISKVSGKWYSILMASDAKEKVEENGSFRMFMEYFQALNNSSLLIKAHAKINGECTVLTFICDETEEKGVYSVPYDGHNTFYITETVYNDYIIIYGLNSNKEKITQAMALHARNPDVSPQLKKRFRKLVQHYGIPKENVVDLSNADSCSQACGSHRGQTFRWVLSDGTGAVQTSLPSKTRRAW